MKANELVLKIKDDLTYYLSCEIQFSKEIKQAWLGQPHLIPNLQKNLESKSKSFQLLYKLIMLVLFSWAIMLPQWIIPNMWMFVQNMSTSMWRMKFWRSFSLSSLTMIWTSWRKICAVIFVSSMRISSSRTKLELKVDYWYKVFILGVSIGI